MNGEKLFGGPARAAGGNSDHDGLKLVLHRYIIDAIEESGKNLLEGTRQSLAQFVIDKVSEYITRMRLAISRYEMERLAEEIVDELTGFGPLEVLLRDPSVTKTWSMGHTGCLSNAMVCCTRATCVSSTTTMWSA